MFMGKVMIEEELLDYVNRKLELQLKDTNADQYCPYDAYDDKYTVELKCRRKHYDTQMIEALKLSNLHKGKEFMYVCSTPKGIYAFNVSKLLKDDYDFKWETRKLPATTDFNRKTWVDKVVGYIHLDEAFYKEEL